MSYWPICVCRCVVQTTGIYHRFIGWGEWRLTSEDHKHWLIQPSFFGGGGGNLAKRPKPGTPKLKLRGFRPLFFGRSQNSLSKKWRNVRFAPAREVPKIIENMTEVDIFDVEEKCAFFMYFSWFWIHYGCVSINCRNILEFRRQFWNFELQKTLKNSLSGNASNLWQRSYL